MSKLISITDTGRFAPDRSGLPRRIGPAVRRTADYRKMLSNMRLRPPSQRAFLKKLLLRAMLTGAPYEFPVPNPAAPTLVDHT